MFDRAPPLGSRSEYRMFGAIAANERNTSGSIVHGFYVLGPTFWAFNF
jgi:hypothetical protein